MSIPVEQSDRIVLEAAGTILEDAERQVLRWKEARTTGGRPRADTGLAQAADLGINVIPEIHALVAAAWDFASAWLDRNQDGIEANALVGGIIAGIPMLHARLRGQRGASGLNDAEVEAIAPVVAREIAKALAERHQP